jgi:uncharacterized protein (TIGR00369 family)
MTDPARAAKTIAQSRFTLSHLMGPQDANILGNVHGGVIMKLVDEAGALVAMRHANQQVVTVAVDSMTFMEPIRLGDLVLCQAALTWVGRSSMEVRVEVVAESPMRGTSRVTNTAYLVYVALDADGRPVPAPDLAYENEDERAQGELARERQAYRKRQREQETRRTI